MYANNFKYILTSASVFCIELRFISRDNSGIIAIRQAVALCQLSLANYIEI